MKEIVITVAILLALGLLALFIFSLMALGSSCSAAEDAAYREYLLKKKQANNVTRGK